MTHISTNPHIHPFPTLSLPSLNPLSILSPQLLNRVCDDDIASAIFFANDFRKVCPPQIPGVEGGYSEVR